MLQVLWDLGWIHTYKLDYCTIRVKKDRKGTTFQDTSMLRIMDQCRGLSEADTQLQYIGRKWSQEERRVDW